MGNKFKLTPLGRTDNDYVAAADEPSCNIATIANAKPKTDQTNATARAYATAQQHERISRLSNRFQVKCASAIKSIPEGLSRPMVGFKNFV